MTEKVPRLGPATRDRLADKARRLLERNRRVGVSAWEGRHFDFVCPSPSHYPFQWFWDSCFHAIALCHVDPRRAAQELRGLVSAAQPDGFIPHIILWERARHEAALARYNVRLGGAYWTATIQPPVLAQALERVVDTSTDPGLLAELLPATIRYYRWLATTRDPDDDGLISIVQPDESGLDACPKYDRPLGLRRHDERALRDRMARLFAAYADQPADRLVELDRFNVEDVLVNAIYGQGLRALGRLCRLANRDREQIEAIEAAADRVTRALIEKCWDPSRGVFWDLSGARERPLRTLTVTSLFPLILADLPSTIADRLVREHLLNPAEFWLPYPVPSVAASEPSFDPAFTVPLIWRGPSWVNTNWFLIDGLRQHGYVEVADELSERTLAMVARSGFREFFNPISAAGYGADSFGWTTLILDLIAGPHDRRPAC